MINLSLANMPEHLDPTEAWNYQQFLLIQAVFDTLVRVNENGRIVASLAKKWSVNSTGQVYTFELHPDAHFHDGKPINSEDVAFSIAKHFWPDSKSVVKVYLDGILAGTDHVQNGQLPSGIKVTGKHSVSFTLVNPYPPFLAVLAMPGFSVFKKNANLARQPNGSGPMKAAFSTGTKSWFLQKFDGYVGIQPKTATFCIQSKTTANDVLKSFHSDELDIAIGVPFSELDPTAVPSNISVLRTNSLVFSHLYLNPTNSLLKNGDFRRDLAALIYSVTERTDLLSPFQKVAPHFIPKGILPSFYYERADNKITIAAFKKRWGSITTKGRLKFILPQSYFGSSLLRALNEAFTKTGLETDIQAVSGPELNSAFDNQVFDVISMPYMGNFPDPDGFLELLHEGSGFKKGFEPSKQLFKTLETARFIPDPGKRLKAYTDALLDFEDKGYVIPLFHVNLTILLRNGVHVPDKSYRYEAELKNLFWLAEER